MKIFSIIGVSQSGKTTTIEAVVAELKGRGYSVGSVKDIHFADFALDQEGTNTYRHRVAGAQLVTARGLQETDVMYQKRLSLREILAFYDHDYVVLEGTYDFKGPGIISACAEQEIDDRWRENIFAVTGQISNRLNEYRGLPVINATRQAALLVDHIEKSVPEWTGQANWLEEDEYE